MALARNADHIQLMRLLLPDFVEIASVVYLCCARALEQVYNDIAVGEEHELGLPSHQGFRVGVDQVHILVLEGKN